MSNKIQTFFVGINNPLKPHFFEDNKSIVTSAYGKNISTKTAIPKRTPEVTFNNSEPVFSLKKSNLPPKEQTLLEKLSLATDNIRALKKAKKIYLNFDKQSSTRKKQILSEINQHKFDENTKNNHNFIYLLLEIGRREFIFNKDEVDITYIKLREFLSTYYKDNGVEPAENLLEHLKKYFPSSFANSTTIKALSLGEKIDSIFNNAIFNVDKILSGNKTYAIAVVQLKNEQSMPSSPENTTNSPDATQGSENNKRKYDSYSDYGDRENELSMLSSFENATLSPETTLGSKYKKRKYDGDDSIINIKRPNIYYMEENAPLESIILEQAERLHEKFKVKDLQEQKKLLETIVYEHDFYKNNNTSHKYLYLLLELARDNLSRNCCKSNNKDIIKILIKDYLIEMFRGMGLTIPSSIKVLKKYTLIGIIYKALENTTTCLPAEEDAFNHYIDEAICMVPKALSEIQDIKKTEELLTRMLNEEKKSNI